MSKKMSLESLEWTKSAGSGCRIKSKKYKTKSLSEKVSNLSPDTRKILTSWAEWSMKRCYRLKKTSKKIKLTEIDCKCLLSKED